MKNLLLIIKLIPVLIFLPTGLFAQDSIKIKKRFRQEIGLDIANTIFLVRKNENIYLLNYKYHFNKHAIRAGLNLNYETNYDGQQSIDSRIGFEWKSTIKKWQVFYGVDLGYSYTKYNFQKNLIRQYIFAPLIGFRYFISPRFSISTEPKIYLKYLQYRNPESFNPNSNSDEYKIALGSIGIVLVNFHF